VYYFVHGHIRKSRISQPAYTAMADSPYSPVFQVISIMHIFDPALKKHEIMKRVIFFLPLLLPFTGISQATAGFSKE
jgi:hypothetical protein